MPKAVVRRSDPVSRGSDLRHWDDIRYTALLEAEDEYADVIANFKVYRIVGEYVTERHPDGTTTSYERGYQRANSHRSPDPVEHLAQAEVFLHGGVKWDGCSDWHFDEQEDSMLHFCGKEEAGAIGTLLCRLYDWARELGMDRC